MERKVTFEPAFDRRSPDPRTDYGIHGVDLRMVLKGEKGAVQFVVYTGWHLPHVTKELDQKPVYRDRPHLLCHPMPADLGYHSPIPQYEGQRPMEGVCQELGGTCYYDGSGLNAERVFEVLLREGSDGVWRELEEYYTSVFGELK